MKFAALSVSICLLAATAAAELTPGGVVRSGAPFPIVADFNGDGLDDLIQERNVLLSNGDAPVTELSLELPSGERVVGALDVNADGIFDLLTEKPGVSLPGQLFPQQTPSQSGYRLRIGNAERRYPQAINITSGGQPYVADADGDGKDDIILMLAVRPDGIRNIGTDMVVLRSKGDGRFEQLEAVRIPADPQLLPDHRVPTADINHDGILDLVVRCVHELAILRGTGGGRFTAESRYMPWGEYGGWSLRLADIDGDSHVDIVSAALRRVRVLFGDGTGNFPRVDTARINKHRNAEGLPPGVPVPDPDRINQPKNLAVGSFVRAGRAEIAAGTHEGDIVIFAYEHGKLKEVSRTETEFWLLDVRTGSFRRNGSRSDLYAGGTLIWGDNWPRPRLFHGANEAAAAATAARGSSRQRASSSSAAQQRTLDVGFSGDCVETTSGRWQFTRDGVFGAARNGEMTMETIADDSLLYFRLRAPYSTEPMYGVLTQEGDVYSGSAQALTSCGWKSLNVSLRIE
jgi:hypothetical protein